MKTEIKEQWIKDLRDPSRRQTTGKLRDEFGAQCCLDVLCEQAVAAGIIDAPQYDKDLEAYIYVWDSGKSETYETLPQPVVDWAEVGDNNPELWYTENGDEQWNSLAVLNDEEHKTFPEIADIIESSNL